MGLICESYLSCWCRKEGVSYANLLVCSASLLAPKKKCTHTSHTRGRSLIGCHDVKMEVDPCATKKCSAPRTHTQARLYISTTPHPPELWQREVS